MAREHNGTCETCGREVQAPDGVHICGTCAEDWNDRDVAAGRKRINRRRKANGLPPLDFGASMR